MKIMFIVVSFIVFFSLGVCAVVFHLRGRRLRRLYQKRLAFMVHAIKDYERRFGLVCQHVDDYILSLGNEGTEAIANLRSLMGDMYDLIYELEQLVVAKDFEALNVILSFIEGDSKAVLPHWSYEATQRLARLQNWDQSMEDLLQLIGHTIGEASALNKQAGVRKSSIRKRQPTSLSLQEARIYLDGYEH